MPKSLHFRTPKKLIRLLAPHPHELMPSSARHPIRIHHVPHHFTMIVHSDHVLLPCRRIRVVPRLEIEDMARIQIDLVILEMWLHERRRHMTIFPNSQ